MNSYETIIKTLQDLAGDTKEGVTFSLTETEDIAHGDYATNIAFPLSKKHGVFPKDYAESVRVELKNSLASVVQKVEVAGPGFINFFLRDEVIRHENGKGDAQIVTKYTGKNVLVEHSSPNLFKPFHIGHLMNNISGEFVVRATKVGGANVTTLSFPSDISLGIAKAIYIIKEVDKKTSTDIFNLSEEEAIPYFGDAYVRGSTLYEHSKEDQIKIKEVSRKIYESEESEDLAIYQNAKETNLSYFIHVLGLLGSSFDKNQFIYESEAGIRGKGVVETYVPEVFTKSEGAIVYVPDENRKDINTAVFINSEGHPTYEAKDIGLFDIKFARYNPDLSITITDTEQIAHFKVVVDAYEKIEKIQKEKHKTLQWTVTGKNLHIPHGRMLFKGAKMSSRLGGVPLALDVIFSVEEEVRERAGEKIAHLGDVEKKKLTREIALSALRIAVLRSKPGININFDPETSLSFEGDSGPYLLYTHARCSSLLEKGNISTPKWSDISVTALERKLIHFENELTHVCNELAPQKLTTYLFSVAQLFNSYYASTQIIVEGDETGNAHRLMIVKRVKTVLKKGLYVLGIEAPERM